MKVPAEAVHVHEGVLLEHLGLGVAQVSLGPRHGLLLGLSGDEDEFLAWVEGVAMVLHHQTEAIWSNVHAAYPAWLGRKWRGSLGSLAMAVGGVCCSMQQLWGVLGNSVSGCSAGAFYG